MDRDLIVEFLAARDEMGLWQDAIATLVASRELDPNFFVNPHDALRCGGFITRVTGQGGSTAEFSSVTLSTNKPVDIAATTPLIVSILSANGFNIQQKPERPDRDTERLRNGRVVSFFLSKPKTA